ncbi:hypothetical protein J4434_05450 [Candidatus Woesearchaeota archaeon]|nr:hypothetical protein [Candidatus Woesearchaeota archaeon]
MKFIIEHLDKRLYKWCFLEYKHISTVVGRDKVMFTNVSGKTSKEKLAGFGTVFSDSIANSKNIVNSKNVLSKRICVLDPFTEKTLSKDDKTKFDYFVFGGILGDYPPQKRTAGFCDKLRAKGIKFETRNLGKEQMSTDTAVYVAKKILEGKKLSDLKFKDTIIIKINESEEVELPFRYVVEIDKQGKENLILPDGFVEFLKKRKSF